MAASGSKQPFAARCTSVRNGPIAALVRLVSFCETPAKGISLEQEQNVKVQSLPRKVQNPEFNPVVSMAWRRSGALGRIRTPDPLIRSQVLYPAELSVHYERN